MRRPNHLQFLTMRTQTSSESPVQSQQSSTPLLKDAAAEDQDVSFSFCNLLVCLLLMAIQSSPLMTSLSQSKSVSRALFHGIGRFKLLFDQDSPLGIG